MKNLPLYSVAAGLLLAGPALASSVEFTTNFDSEIPELGATPTGFEAVSNSVDIIGSGPNGTAFDLLPGNGYYLDLAGDAGGTIATTETFDAGTYELTFELAANNRDASADVVNVLLGDFSETISFAAADFATGFETFSFAFTTTTAGALTFSNDGTDVFGALLDSVSLVGDTAAGVAPDPVDNGVTAVPTPAALSAGLLGLGALMGRRRRNG